MSDEASEQLAKAHATFIAESLAGDHGQTAVEIMAGLGLLESPPPSGFASAGSAEPRVGIWEEREQDGEIGFVRSEAFRNEWNLWANVPIIPPKGVRKRVLLIGESAAAGYLYGWNYRPAQVLQSILDAMEIPEGVEVIDLARVGASHALILDITTNSFQLQPDALVFFVGNNMTGAPATTRVGWQQRAREYLAGGATAYRRAILQELSAAVSNGLSFMAQIAENIFTVWILPETNLLDWNFGNVVGTPWLSKDNTARWWDCLQRARGALAGGHFDQAEVLATKLGDMDGGLNPQSYAIQAQCKMKQGRMREARDFLEKARDARIWDEGRRYAETPPRVSSLFQEAVLQAFRGTQVSIVDLRRVFEEWTGGGIPGRELFVDYCHLTSQGIRVAMAATAGEIAAGLGGKNIPSRAGLVEIAKRPEPKVEGLARLGAMIHNSELGQNPEIIAHHGAKALEAWPDLREVFLGLLEKSPAGPPWMSAAVISNDVAEYQPLWPYLLARRGTHRALGDVMADLLEKRGIPGKQSWLKTLKDTYSIRMEKPETFLRPDERNSSRAGSETGSTACRYYKTFEPTSEFPFFLSSPAPLMLRLVARRPCSSEEQPCEVQINDQCIGKFLAHRKWTTVELLIEQKHVLSGSNVLCIYWPMDLHSPEAFVKDAAASLQRRVRGVDWWADSAIEADCMFPVFGEIHSISLSLSNQIILR